jgi:YkoY family integral membrane protein
MAAVFATERTFTGSSGGFVRAPAIARFGLLVGKVGGNSSTTGFYSAFPPALDAHPSGHDSWHVWPHPVFHRGAGCLIPMIALLAWPTSAELLEAVPVIISLIIIEGLLSVDNALAIAAMAAHLPGKQKYQALKWGIVGAYLFRGLCLAFAAWIIENPWLKIGGAAYLIYLMSEHFTGGGDDEEAGAAGASVQRGFVATIVAIEVMDLSLSVDNVVAAVAMSPKLWVVCAGVFIGILALRFVAGTCIRLIEKFPILEDTAFILIGYVGLILCYELLSDPHSGLQLLPGPVHVSAAQKFVGIVLILGASLLYSRSPRLQMIMRPVLRAAHLPMKLIAFSVGMVLKAVFLPFRLAWQAIRPAK